MPTRSEFQGVSGPAGIAKKPHKPTVSELLTLGYRTGTMDPDAPLDRRVWTGEAKEDPVIRPTRRFRYP